MSHHRDTSPITRSMMSGQSPVSPNEIFDLKEISSPTSPSTSRDMDNHRMNTSTMLVDIDGHQLNFSSTGTDLKSNISMPYIDDETLKIQDTQPAEQRSEDETKEELRKLNGDADKLDGVCIPKDEREQDEEDFCVKCLYFSMKCCECSIM